MNINHRSVRAVLSVMEKSTDHRYYAAELARAAGLSEATTYKVLATLESARFVDKQKERLGSYADRAPRIYYEPTQYFLDAYRLTPLSSI
jgi:DNA-binding PadR family transcriptional regulator